MKIEKKIKHKVGRRKFLKVAGATTTPFLGFPNISVDKTYEREYTGVGWAHLMRLFGNLALMISMQLMIAKVSKLKWNLS